MESCPRLLLDIICASWVNKRRHWYEGKKNVDEIPFLGAAWLYLLLNPFHSCIIYSYHVENVDVPLSHYICVIFISSLQDDFRYYLEITCCHILDKSYINILK